MSRTTATLLLSTLLLGAILWIALGGHPSDTADEGQPSPARPEPMPEQPLEAGPAALHTQRNRRGPLVLVLRSSVPRVLEGGLLLVRLRSEETGGNALLATRKDGVSFTHASLPWKPAPRAVRDGADIRATFPGIPQGHWTVEVVLRGPLVGKASAPPVEVDVVEEGAEAFIELGEAPLTARVRVHVVQGGRTVGEARIEAFLRALRVLYINTRDPRDPEIDAFHDVPADKDLEIRVSHYRGQSLFGKLEPKRVRLAPGESRDIVFEVPPGQQVRIQAVSRYGEQVQAGLVLWRREAAGLIPLDVLDGFLPEKKGWAGVLPAGAYRAMVTPRAHYARAAQDFDVAYQDEPLGVEIPVGDDGIRVTLALTDAAGGPAIGVRFNLNRITEDASAADFFIGKTDEQGEQVSRPLVPGRYRLYLWDLDLSRELSITKTRSAHALQLPPPVTESEGVSISGVVSFPDGGPANGIYLHARPDGDAWERTGRCDADGRFEIKGLEPGAYDVFAPTRLLDKRVWRATSRRVVLGTTSTTIKLRLQGV